MASTRANGARSRRAVVIKAVELTAARGRERTSVAAIAQGLGMSKAGVFAHFGSKDALDAAMIDAAAERFGQSVLGPAGAAPPGLARLAALCEAFVVFAASSGPALTARDPAFGVPPGGAAARQLAAWAGAWQLALESAAAEAIARGELADGAEASQVAFDLAALLDGAAARRGGPPDGDLLRRTRAAVDRMLRAWSAP